MAVAPFGKSVRCRQFPAAAQWIALFIRTRTISQNSPAKGGKTERALLVVAHLDGCIEVRIGIEDYTIQERW